MTRLAAVALLFAATGADSAKAADDPYAPKGGGFSVRFPGKPREAIQKPKGPLGELRVFSATFATAEGNVYLVSYTDFPAGTTKTQKRSDLLDAARDGLKGKDGKVLSETDIVAGPDKSPGREIELEKGKQRVRCRVVLRGDRLYQVGVIGTPAFATGKEAAAFLGSFELNR